MGCYINPALSRRLRAGHSCLSLLPSHSDGIKMIFEPTVQTWVEDLFHSQKKSQKVPSLLENWISVESEVGARTDQDFTSKTKNTSKRPLEVSSLPNNERQTCIHVFSCSAARDSCCSQNKSRLIFYWYERAISLLLYKVMWHGEVHSRNLVFCTIPGLLFSFCSGVCTCSISGKFTIIFKVVPCCKQQSTYWSCWTTRRKCLEKCVSSPRSDSFDSVAWNLVICQMCVHMGDPDMMMR